ncbi:DUF1127 domain-containing protein [Neorhizobium sp. P12A]|uniref:DUF1127 domain-containing protein n=1 Tax=Neorhizobium sp. P12A TaxID=2268027 RepID=UPI0011EEED53|nr:DUF1127 domain-containing protein [Neorhizobium sp. P12A]KAA0695402.1 DUF1127 domain-containing protein [Neorhizobium sp. P12A]
MLEILSITKNLREVSKRLSSPLQTLCAPWKAIMRHLVRRTGAARLRDLDGDALWDIGLARSEIRAAAFGLMAASNDRTLRRD